MKHKLIWLTLIALFLFVPLVDAAHTYDTSQTYQTTAWSSANPGTLSYTASAGATLMVLSIQTSAALRTLGTPTFNGKSFTNIGRIYDGSEGASELWYLLLTSSDTGSAYTVSVPNAATSRSMTYQVSTYISSTGISALDLSTSGGSAGSADPSQTLISTANGDVYVSALFSGRLSCGTVTSPGTELYCNDGGSFNGNSQYYLQTTAGSQAIGWTLNSDDWAMQTAAFKEVNPLPTTSSISPNSKNVGDSSFTMTVTGTNFVSGSIVRIDGIDRATTYGSSTSLTAVILTSDMTSAGTHSITVFNPTTGGGTSNAQTFTVTSLTYSLNTTYTFT